MTLSITAVSMITLSIMTQGITKGRIMTLITMTRSITTVSNDTA
jgi:hypothetical protein